jgi:type I restriction enzyme M protein
MPDNIAHIMEAIESRQDIPHFSKLVSLDQIQENGYNLSVSSFVEQKEVIEKSRHCRQKTKTPRRKRG